MNINIRSEKVYQMKVRSIRGVHSNIERMQSEGIRMNINIRSERGISNEYKYPFNRGIPNGRIRSVGVYQKIVVSLLNIEQSRKQRKSDSQEKVIFTSRGQLSETTYSQSKNRRGHK